MATRTQTDHNTSAKRLEILATLSFERHLVYLEEEATSLQNRSSSVFHLNVRNLEERFEQLARLRGDFAGTYEYRVRALCDCLLPLKFPSDRESKASEAETAIKLLSQFVDGKRVSLSSAEGCLWRDRAKPHVPQQGDNSSQQTLTGPSPNAQPTLSNRKFKPISISEATQSRLNKQEQQQEVLTDELVDLSARLKGSVKALSSQVADRNSKIDDTRAGLEKSVQGTKKNVSSIDKSRRAMRMNMCFSVVVLLVVMGTFAGMLTFIRVSRFLGYKRVQPKHDESHATEL